MSDKRFYIGAKGFEDYMDTIEEWIADRIGNPPAGAACECDTERHSHVAGADGDYMVTIIDCPDSADTHSYRIEGDHICYSWLCTPCMEATTSEDYMGDIDAVPATAGGYAVVPRHCY